MNRRLIIGVFGLLWASAAPGQEAAAPARELPEISWEETRSHIGKECRVVGKVLMARNIGSRCFLNFHENFRENFTVVINQENFNRFPSPPETLYADKRVRVSGMIIDFQGKPEIVVTAPEQIVVLDETPGAASRPAGDKAAASADKPPPPAPKPSVAAAFDGTVTLATFNVLNLFDDHDDPYHADEGTPAKPSEERTKLAQTFRTLNADVVALQEVENRGVLEEFNRSMLSELHYSDVVLFEGNDDRGIDVALLSRLPVGPVTSYSHVAFKDANGRGQHFRRDLLRVRIEPPGAKSFDVLVMHLKSKQGGEESTVIRMAEATAARAILDDMLRTDPTARFLFCGDLNDTFESEPIRKLVGAGPQQMKAFFDELPVAQRITYNQAPHESMIDFIFASPAMSERFEAGSYRIYAGSVESGGSDHNPVSARFSVN